MSVVHLRGRKYTHPYQQVHPGYKTSANLVLRPGSSILTGNEITISRCQNIKVINDWLIWRKLIPKLALCVLTICTCSRPVTINGSPYRPGDLRNVSKVSVRQWKYRLHSFLSHINPSTLLWVDYFIGLARVFLVSAGNTSQYQWMFRHFVRDPYTKYISWVSHSSECYFVKYIWGSQIFISYRKRECTSHVWKVGTNLPGK